jgi:hypothetical protein
VNYNLKSSVIVIGLLLAFFLGGVTVSLAQDGLSVRAVVTLGWHPSQPKRTLPLDDYNLHVGLSAESGAVLALFTRAAQGFSLLAEPLDRCGPVAVSHSLIARKVSLHLFDSILLI